MKFSRILSATGVLGLTALGVAGPAEAAGTQYSATSNVTVSGSTATATTKVSASPSTTAQSVGVCARSASGANVDFDLRRWAWLSSNATTVTDSQQLSAGKYTYFTCVQSRGSWVKVGSDKTFTVGSTSSPTTSPTTGPTTSPTTSPTTRPTATATVSPTSRTTSPSSTPTSSTRTSTTTPTSTTTAPTSSPTTTASNGTTSAPQGDLSGWKQIFVEDFNTNAATGSFPGSAYSSKWTSYDGFQDTSKHGTYSPGKVLSVHDGTLDMYLHTENGVPLVAAPVPLVNGQWLNQTYGRYSVRFKADPVPGYKTAWLLWSATDNWNDGEIDFPEGELNGSIGAFNHCPGNPSANCSAFGTGATFTSWHTATTEWTPSGVTFYLDGQQIGHSTTSPSAAMHWVLQTETSLSGNAPSASAAGHVYVDWATMYSRS